MSRNEHQGYYLLLLDYGAVLKDMEKDPTSFTIVTMNI